MKNFTRNLILLCAICAIFTSMFVSCKKDTTLDIPTSSSITQTDPSQNGTHQSAGAGSNSMFKKYWVGSTKDASERVMALKENAVKTDDTVLDGKFTVYEDVQEVISDDSTEEVTKTRFIISYVTRINLADGDAIPVNAYGNLRLEQTGEKVYAFDTQTSLDLINKAVEDFNENVAGGKTLTLAEREKIGHYFGDVKLFNKNDLSIRLNGIVPTVQSGKSGLRVTHGGVRISDLARAGIQYGFISDFDTQTEKLITFNVVSASSTFKVEITLDDMNKIASVTSDDKIVKVTEIEDTELQMLVGDNIISLEDMGNVLGWDFDMYYETGILNIITDTEDAFNVENTVVTPEKSTTQVIIQEERPEAPFEKSEVTADGKTSATIKSGPNKGKELLIPTDEAWDALTSEEQREYWDALDPEKAAWAQQPGETKEEWLERTDKPSEAELAKVKELLGF